MTDATIPAECAPNLSPEEKGRADDRITRWVEDVKKQQAVRPVLVLAEYRSAMDALRELAFFELDGAQLSSIHDSDRMLRHAGEGGFQPRKVGASGAGIVADRLAVTGKVLGSSIEGVERYGLSPASVRSAIFCRFLFKKKVSDLAERLGVTARQLGRATRSAFTLFENDLHLRGFMGIYESEEFEFDLVGWDAIAHYLDKSRSWCLKKRGEGMPVYGSKDAGIYAIKSELAKWMADRIRKNCFKQSCAKKNEVVQK